MEIKIGCDLVHIKKFQQSINRGKAALLDKLFSSHELAASSSLQTLAGIFAAKEAAGR